MTAKDFDRDRRTDMSRTRSARVVTTADHSLPAILPMISDRRSSVVRAGISTNRASSQNACASMKSIPCLPLFARLLFSSNSNSASALLRRYRNYTVGVRAG